MTMILTLGNRDQVLLLSDRRLSAQGKVVDEEAGKSGALVCSDSHFVFGFTGIARTHELELRRWLLDALNASGPPDYTMLNIIERLKLRANRDFAQLDTLRKLKPEQKRFAVLFSGYLIAHNPPMIGCSILSNFMNLASGVATRNSWDEFFTSYTCEKDPRIENPTTVQRVGDTAAWKTTDEIILREFLEARKPAQAIIGKAIEVMLDIATRLGEGGTIGKQITWIMVPSDPTKGFESGYYSNIRSYATFMPSMVFLLPSGQTIFDDVSISVVEPENTPPIAVPKVGRNAPCPCGSGLKYKKCHGR